VPSKTLFNYRKKKNPSELSYFLKGIMIVKPIIIYPEIFLSILF